MSFRAKLKLHANWPSYSYTQAHIFTARTKHLHTQAPTHTHHPHACDACPHMLHAHMCACDTHVSICVHVTEDLCCLKISLLFMLSYNFDDDDASVSQCSVTIGNYYILKLKAHCSSHTLDSTPMYAQLLVVNQYLLD